MRVLTEEQFGVDVEKLRAQASDSMVGDVLPSQMQDFSA